ncbi:MAG: outer membrane beta-barrel protein [Bacteroidia bacterium]
MKNSLIIAVLLFVTPQCIFSQGNESFTKKEVSVILGAGNGAIKNDNIKNDVYATTPKSGISPNFGINYAYYFKKNVGINFGLEFNQFKSTTYYKAVYRSTQTTTDRDGYLFYRQVEADYTDKRTLSTLDIPLALRLQSYNENFQVFADVGMKFNIRLNSKFEENGSFANKGVYPIQNYPNQYALIENNGYYGYSSTKYAVSHDLGDKAINYALFVGAGIKVKLKDNAFVLINPAYMFGLSDIISTNKQTTYTTIAGDALPYQKFTLSQFVLRLGIGFKI